MPRFVEKPSEFTVAVDWQGESITLRVRWTPRGDDEFACLWRPDPEGRMIADKTKALDLLVRQTVGWEGVEDANGEAVEFSPEQFSSLLPGVLKMRLIQRFVNEAITFALATSANPT